MSEFLNRKQAARYVGIEERQLLAMLKKQKGPVFYRPTPNKRLFKIDDLDAWAASWKRVEPAVTSKPAE